MKTKNIISTWARVLAILLEGRSEGEQEKTITRLEDMLRLKKKDYLLPKILEETEKIFDKKIKIELTLAREVGKDVQDALKKKLTELLGESKKIEMKIDESIIGGFVAKTENYLINASIKDYLNQLKKDTMAG